MKLLCAVKRCRNRAPGMVSVERVKGVTVKGRKFRKGGGVIVRRNVCDSCIEKIRTKYGIE